MVDLRARAKALFGASELVDWAAIAFGLVAKYRNVTAKKLTRERVEQGCQILFEFYTLRRKAGVAAAAAAGARRRRDVSVLLCSDLRRGL